MDNNTWQHQFSSGAGGRGAELFLLWFFFFYYFCFFCAFLLWLDSWRETGNRGWERGNDTQWRSTPEPRAVAMRTIACVLPSELYDALSPECEAAHISVNSTLTPLRQSIQVNDSGCYPEGKGSRWGKWIIFYICLIHPCLSPASSSFIMIRGNAIPPPHTQPNS